MVSKNIKIGIAIVLILNFIVLLYSLPRKLKNKEKSVNLNLQSLKLNGDMESGEYGFKKSAVQPEKEPKSVCGFVNHKEEKIYFGVDNLKISVHEASSDYSCRKTCCEAPNVSAKEKYHSPDIYYVVNEQMTEKQINELLKNGESEKAEFKKSTAQLEKGLKAVCAFLNHDGGSVYFGIHGGKVVGQEVSDSTLKSISQKIRQNIKPEISPEITVSGTGKEKVIEVKVKEGLNKPYYLNGIAYKRVGAENLMIPPEELERIIIEKRVKQWDSEICEEANLGDVNEEKVRWFLSKAKHERGYPLDENTPVKDALTHLGLLTGGRLINAALVLFGKEPQKLFLQSEVKCLHFHGTEVEKPFESYQIYKGNIFQQIDNSIDFVLDRLKRPVIPEPGRVATKRPYEIPEFVVREAIVNAVAHRDYCSNAGVQIMFFADRIEIWNPGELPVQLKIADLGKPHPSLPKNPAIANILSLTKYVEKAGSGTIEMIRQCKERNLPEPEFEQKMGSFVVTIWKDIYTEDYLNRSNLNERQKKAIKYIKERESITNAEYRKLTGASKWTSTKDLTNLANKGILSRTGKGKRDIKYALVSGSKSAKKVPKNLNEGNSTPDVTREFEDAGKQMHEFDITGLNERQEKALECLKTHGIIKREDYAKLFKCSVRTAFNDINDLVSKSILKRVGKTGRYTHYVLSNVQSNVQSGNKGLNETVKTLKYSFDDTVNDNVNQ